MKPIRFHPEALRFIRTLSVELKKQVGEVLRDVQKGILPGMPINKPMPDLGPGVFEVRVKDRSKAVRVFLCCQDQGIHLGFSCVRETHSKDVPTRDCIGT